MNAVRRILRFGTGVRTPHIKNTAERETAVMPLPERIIIPMSQHVGAPCVPVVKAGDTVEVGQVVGDSQSPISAPIHSGVSGRVVSITELTLPGGVKTAAVVIEPDGEQRIHPGVKPQKVESFDDFIKAVRASGLVGLGGAGFPTHIKLNPPNLKDADTLIINAAECEPYITSDYRECIENPADIMSGIQAVMKYLDIKHAIIAVERDKPRAKAVLSKLAAEYSAAGREIEVKSLPVRYPQGAEKVLIYSCTDRRVPPGKLPANIGCIVLNVASVSFISKYLKTGMPLVERRITVDGSAVAKPQNVRVVIGTPIRDVIEFCGGAKGEIRKLLMGGPMMGLALMDDQLPVLKQNNAILAFLNNDVLAARQSDCIRCGRCVRACPMNLLPPSIEAAYRTGDTERLEKLSVMNCMECGCCSFVCPASRQLVQSMRMAKGEFRKAAAAERAKAGAGQKEKPAAANSRTEGGLKDGE